MKLSSKVLAGSLASAGMVLSLVAPALTAQAATTTGSVDKTTGAVTEIKDGSDIGKLNNDDGLLAIAYEGNAKGATATSNASVTVVDGILTLDYVPDFNFGTAAAGGTVSLKDNTKDETNTALPQDGNDAGTLQVTEGRSNTPGFTLDATLGSFSDTQGNKVTSATDPFKLTLNPVNLFDGPDKITNAGGKQLQTNASVMSDDNTAATASVMAFKNGADGYKMGQYQATYHDPDTASLHVSKDAKSQSSTSATSYNANVTWTLKAAATTPEG